MLFDSEDESLDIDNQEQVEETTQEPAEAQGDDGQQRQGDLSVALRQEREKRREVEDRLRQIEDASNRDRMLLERLNQPKQQSREEQTSQFQEQLFSDPLSVRESLLREAKEESLRAMRPALEAGAKSMVSTHPDYVDLYREDEIFKEYADKWVSNELEYFGTIDAKRMNAALTDIKRLRSPIAPKPSANSGKERATSTVDKGKGSGSNQTGSALDVYKQKINDLSPKELYAWEKDPKNQDLIQRAKDEHRKSVQG